MMTQAPPAAKRRAVAAPMPLTAPVTMATLSAHRTTLFPLFVSDHAGTTFVCTYGVSGTRTTVWITVNRGAAGQVAVGVLAGEHVDQLPDHYQPDRRRGAGRGDQKAAVGADL